MRLGKRIGAAFIRNPTALLFLVLFLVAEYGNYQRGKELTAVCEIVDIENVDALPKASTAGIAARICADRSAGD